MKQKELMQMKTFNQVKLNFVKRRKAISNLKYNHISTHHRSIADISSHVHTCFFKLMLHNNFDGKIQKSKELISIYM